jgi:hypothetical protein
MRSAAILALALAVQCAAANAAVKLPPPPASAAVNPVRLEPGQSQVIAFMGAVFRIQMGAKIGTAYGPSNNEVLRELRWEKGPGRSREFDVATNDRLREFGYAVVDSMTTPFEDNKRPEKSRVQMGVIISRVQNDYFMKRDYFSYGASDQSYGIATMDVEVQLADADSQDIIYRKQFQAYGIEQGKSPLPMIPAFLNGIDHALSDPEFVAKLKKSESPSPATASSYPPLVIARCEVSATAHLPEQIGVITDSVVRLRAGSITGSGVVVSPAGYILTAAHVVKDRQSISVKLKSGLELDAQVLRVDSSHDVALLQLPGRGYPCSPVSRDMPPVGSDIFIVGTPLDEKLMNTVTRGIVSGHREEAGLRLIQTDASVNPGTSGGPLFDVRGQVRAIVSLKVFGVGIEGVAFGVPMDVFASRLALDIK